ncbi:hypothetical protein BC943DRAFT_340251 [Umbelopsis sp. AD052]|nr:hypothetical protein BC943DRAFT_340251 [Umbelopsis sp. AD052]
MDSLLGIRHSACSSDALVADPAQEDSDKRKDAQHLPRPALLGGLPPQMELLDEDVEVQEAPTRYMVARQSLEHDIATADQADRYTESQRNWTNNASHLDNSLELQCQNKGELPGGRPSTDFVLVSPFQVIFDPKLEQFDHVNWLMAPWRDLAYMASNKTKLQRRPAP